MPPAASDSLRESEHVDIIAYILAANGLAGGDEELRADSNLVIGSGEAGEESQGKWESWSAAGTIEGEAKSRSGFVNRLVENFQPVTDQMLQQPPAADWLSWRRTQDGQGYSPLDQVTRDNVADLKLAWVLAMKEGSNQVTPLVHDGVMYLTHPGNVIQAVDASNGELIWEYGYTFPPESKTLGGPTRNIALYGDKLFMATYDAALVAVDARTGEQLWRTVKADYSEGYTHTSGPIVGNGVVLSGINGCERFKKDGCFVTGHDPETGDELWRTSTIALPGDPNDDSWGGKAPELRAGGDTWIPGSYDPELELFFIGTSQAKPWVAASRGMSPLDAALYTNSTLALNPTTGKIAWYFQHIPGETIDMEVGFERVLVDGTGSNWLFTVGKDGILWKLDRRTGEFVDFTETVSTRIFCVAGQSGRTVTYRQDIIDAGIGDPISACPGIYGGHNWQATAYSPEAGALVIPLHQLCAEMVGREVATDARLRRLRRRFQLLRDARQRRQARETCRHGRGVHAAEVDARATGDVYDRGADHRRRPGLRGDLDRYFKAFDVESGELLWQTRLGAPTQGFPITYAVDGQTVCRRAHRHRRVPRVDGGDQPGDLSTHQRARPVRIRTAGAVTGGHGECRSRCFQLPSSLKRRWG